MHNDPPAEMIGAQEVADLLGVSVWTVRSWVRRRTGPRYYRIVGSIRYDRDEVLAYKAAQAVGS